MAITHDDTARARSLSAEEILELSRRYTLFDWAAQSTVRPLPVASAKGVYFTTADGRRYLDFNSQLMSVNAGHGQKRIADAIAAQAAQLAYISPFHTTAVRALLGEKLASLLPGDIDKVFFTLGGAEANENAIRMARMYTGRQKILARYRSYHGATSGMMAVTGDPRRWPNEFGIPGVVHVLDPYHGYERGWEDAASALDRLEETIQLEGPATIAAFILEPVTGTNGILIPPPGYLAGVRALCDRHGILMIADEVMSGFGRTGKWFAVDHWDVVPDLITMAKGLTSSYVPLGAVGLRRRIADHFEDHVFAGGLTYNSHPLGCAAALATIGVYEEDGLVENARRMGEELSRGLARLAERHRSVGEVRSIGLFAAIEVARDPVKRIPMALFNQTSPEMIAISKYLLDHGLYTLVHWNQILVVPPLCITSDELAEGLAIIDGALDVADRSVTS